MIKNNSVTLGKDYDELLDILKKNQMLPDLHSAKNIKTIYEIQSEKIQQLQEQVQMLEKLTNTNTEQLNVIQKYIDARRQSLSSFTDGINKKSTDIVRQYKEKGKSGLKNIKSFFDDKVEKFVNAELSVERKLYSFLSQSMQKTNNFVVSLQNIVKNLEESINGKVDFLEKQIQNMKERNVK